MSGLGKRRWAFADGYIPSWSTETAGYARETGSHESVSLLNSGDTVANVTLTLYFNDREPAGPYRVTVAPRRTHHVRFNDLADPEHVPTGKEYSCVIESDVPLVAQHTRLDSRQAALAVFSTIAFSQD